MDGTYYFLHISVQFYQIFVFRHLAHISYLFGRIGQAVSHQKQGLLASERVLGIDHYETIYCYVYLALFAHNLAQTSVALRLMYRAKYLLQLIFGPDHLEQAAFDVSSAFSIIVSSLHNMSCDYLRRPLSPVLTCKLYDRYRRIGQNSINLLLQINIGLMLHTKGDSVNSQKFLESALKLHKKFHGSGSVQVRRKEPIVNHLSLKESYLTLNISSIILWLHDK